METAPYTAGGSLTFWGPWAIGSYSPFKKHMPTGLEQLKQFEKKTKVRGNINLISRLII